MKSKPTFREPSLSLSSEKSYSCGVCSYSCMTFFPTNFREAQRLNWFGHLHRMPEDRIVKRVYKWKLILT
jgi:hypothetical protein